MPFPTGIVDALDPARLPKTWRKSPPPRTLQQIGDDWFRKVTSPILRVPSVIVPGEWNYLLNPHHANFPSIRIGPMQPIRFDRRLLKRSTS